MLGRFLVRRIEWQLHGHDTDNPDAQALCLEWAIACVYGMGGPERGREHFNDAVGWLTFRPAARLVPAGTAIISSASAASSGISNTVLLAPLRARLTTGSVTLSRLAAHVI
jgi:hypothetical protein